MKKVTLKLTGILMLLTTLQTVNAQSDVKINAVTTAVPFLRISPDARAGAMGETGVATSPDANSIFWNNAKAAFMTDKLNVAASYTPWLSDLNMKDVFLANLSASYKLDDVQAISGSLRFFSLGNIQFTDDRGNELNQFTPRELALDAAYSRKLSDKIGLGVGLRYISSNLAGGAVGFNGVTYRAGSSVAGDIHFYYQGVKSNGEGFNWGATLSNLGSKISYTSDATQKDYIPANFALGGSYTKVFDADSKLSFALDLNKLLVPTPPTDTAAAALADYRDKGVVSSWFSSWGDSEGSELKEFNVSMGAEFTYKNQFAFRAGYFYEDRTKGDRRYFTLGAGLNYSTYGLNFAYIVPTGSGVNRNPLSNTLRFSLLYNMSKK
jgi:hypothetical protein